jgi:ABC-type glutathione transport system ATPase component
MTTLLHATGLSVSYGERRVSFIPELSVDAGECVAIVGESGSGKTSALLALLGLQPKATVGGAVTMFGVDDVLSSRERLRPLLGDRAALVSQSPIAALNPTMRLQRFGELALRRHGSSKGEARTALLDAAASVSLAPEVLTRYPVQISGGQAQRFAIALALALGAELILADEPTSALDVTVQAEIVDLLARLRRERGLGLLIVSHDIALISRIADRVIVMRNGEVVESGPVEEVVRRPAADYTRALIAAVPRLGGGER